MQETILIYDYNFKIILHAPDNVCFGQCHKYHVVLCSRSKFILLQAINMRFKFVADSFYRYGIKVFIQPEEFLYKCFGQTCWKITSKAMLIIGFLLSSSWKKKSGCRLLFMLTWRFIWIFCICTLPCLSEQILLCNSNQLHCSPNVHHIDNIKKKSKSVCKLGFFMLYSK